MGRKYRRMDEGTIIPARRITLDKLCTDLAHWPQLWAIEHSDVTIGQRIVESIQPFLIDLLQQGLADKTLILPVYPRGTRTRIRCPIKNLRHSGVFSVLTISVTRL
jgi:hypothetical protein